MNDEGYSFTNDGEKIHNSWLTPSEEEE